MPLPLADLYDLWSASVKVWERCRAWADEELTADIADFLALLDGGEYADTIATGIESFRAGASALVSPRAPQGYQAGLLAEWVRSVEVNRPVVSVADQLHEIRNYNRANAVTVKTRALSIPSVASAVSVPSAADGLIHVLSLDSDGQTIEATHVERKVLRCVQDSYSGAAPGQEVFALDGENRGRTWVGYRGSGIRTQIVGMTANQSALNNASFNSIGSDGASATKFASWTIVGTPAAFTADSDSFRADGPGTQTQRSLLYVGAGDTIQQSFTARPIVFDSLGRQGPFEGRPVAVVLAVKPSASETGTLRVHLGATTYDVDLTQDQGVWTQHVVTLDEGLWPEVFGATAAGAFKLQFLATASIGVRVDDVVMANMQRVDNLWWLAVGGSKPWRINDEYEFETTQASRQGIVQECLHRTYGFYFPHTAGAPTIDEPA